MTRSGSPGCAPAPSSRVVARSAILDRPQTGKMIAETDGPIGRLIFNNPARPNAVSLEM
jgi:hypothetical protein